MFIPKINSSIRDKRQNYNVSEVKYSYKKLKHIKLCLMSRNVQKQIICIDYIIQCLSHPKGSPLHVDVFLVDDIPGLLCDVMNNHKGKLIRKVFICLTLLSKSALFYKERHALVVLETTIRTMKILIKDISQVIVIKNGLKLLSQILYRLHMKNTLMMPKILSLVRSIVFTPLLQSLHLKAVFTLHFIMKDLILLNNCHFDLLCVFERVLKLLRNITNSSSVNAYTRLLSDNIHNCLRLCYQLTLKENNPPGGNSTTILEKVRSLLWQNITNIISPTLIKNLKECSVEDLNKILKCLLTALQKMSPSETNKLSHYLAAKGYLIVLPKIYLHFRNDKLTKLSKTLMSELVSQLCESALKIGKFCNKQQFQFCIDKGLSVLPMDISLWMETLIHGSSKYGHYTVIIYMYFMLLSSMGTLGFQHYFTAVCSYLISLKSTIPLPILKALWLIYAITSLSTSGRQISNKDLFRKASRKLIDMLQSQKNLQVVYTHHPAIIYWSFQSDYVDRKMQCTVMKLWFSDDTCKEASYSVMLEMIMNCHWASLCLFEVLRNCNLNVVEEGVRILREVISRDKANGSSGLSTQIWKNLPQILSYSSFSVRSVMTVNYILYLASWYIPSNLDSALLVRLSIQVDKLICRFTGQQECYTILRFLLSKLGLNILMNTFSAGDITILKIFLDNEKLIKVLIEASCVRHPYSLINSNLQFLEILIHCQHYYNVKSNSNINIKGDILLELLSSPKFEELASTLTILSVMFDSTKKIRPLICFNKQVEIGLIQRLFYQLLMLCAKSNYNISKSCWKNQLLLLTFCKTHKIKDLEIHLATHPFTYLALQNCMLPSSSYFWQFVSTWLDILQKKTSSVFNSKRDYYKSLCRDSMSTTVMDISHELIKQLNSETVNEVQENITMKIIMLNVNIPQDIVKVLKGKVFDFNKIYNSPDQRSIKL